MGKARAVLHQGVTGASEVDGKKFSWGRVKLRAIAPPQQAREPPTTHTSNSSKSPLNTRSPSNTGSPQTQDPQPSILLRFLVPHPPPLSQHQAPLLSAGIYRFQRSRATRAATSPPTPPSVEMLDEIWNRRKHPLLALSSHIRV